MGVQDLKKYLQENHQEETVIITEALDLLLRLTPVEHKIGELTNKLFKTCIQQKELIFLFAITNRINLITAMLFIFMST